ncbi:unnamed protein product [Oppiella nova]|uniref:BTB domain-containing protein n=1 Tax=Oppiella nova TaxID=334625 RepID=A0A7R9MAA8_9ACAR|nr:unnamed protein product [Oppiella nova]CAG2173706.1 unnamed protein product [Oppiella nova]
MDSFNIIKKFPQLYQLKGKYISNTANIKLLAVLGSDGSDVIIVTKDYNVYCFGVNRYGRLGLGVGSDVHFERPQLNESLSGKGLSKMIYGLGHCIGLTTSGQCYGWGHNFCGQLGLGSTEDMSTPQLIQVLSNKCKPKKIIGVCCGDNHTLWLTFDGLVYGSGSNDCGQTGAESNENLSVPTRVAIDEEITFISCGQNHSTALSVTGKVYVWGSNGSRQLGHCIPHGQTYSRSPREVYCYDNKFRLRFWRAICGPNHTVLIADNNRLYTYGYSSWKPVDRYDHSFNAIDPEDNRTTFRPIDIPVPSTGFSLFNIYAKFCGFDMTFESIAEQIKSMDTSIAAKPIACDYNDWNNDSNDKYSAEDGYSEIYMSDVEESDVENLPKVVKNTTSQTTQSFASDLYLLDPLLNKDLPQKSDSDENGVSTDPITHSTNSYICDKQCHDSDVLRSEDNITSTDSMTSELSCNPIIRRFHRQFSEAFNNPFDSDLTFKVQNKFIYCNKSVLKIQNNKFWETECQQNLMNENEIHIKSYSYETFVSLLMYFYGLTPEVNDNNCTQLLKLAKEYGELELKDLPFQKH